MSKIIFIQPDTSEYTGTMSLASLIKKSGHKARVSIALESKIILEELRQFSPDIVAFSCMTPSYLWAMEQARIIKKNYPLPIIFGGCHPTFNPEIILEPDIDMLCCGEGEYPLLELLDALGCKGDATKINNLSIKHNTEVHRNEVRPLLEDLDALPFPDRSVYYEQYDFLKNYPAKHFMSGRGCPYDCSFCFNHQLLKIYQGKGKYVRRKSPGYFVSEIEEVKNRYGIKVAIFDDDIFAVNAQWLSEFIPMFIKRVGVPFSCTIRVDVVTEEIIKLLKKGGCFQVSFGLETGNEELRRIVLKKRITNKQIIETAKLLKYHKIPFLTNNMMGIPTETIEQACETIKLNSLIGTDVPWCSIMQPFPKTDIAGFAISKGLLDSDYDKAFYPSFFSKNPIRQENIYQLWNLQKFFIIAVKFPFILPLLKLLIKFPPNKLLDLFFLATYFTTYKRRHNVSWFKVLLISFTTSENFFISNYLRQHRPCFLGN